MENKTWEDIYNQLRKPFPVNSVRWRVGATNKDKTSGIALAYIDSRDVQKRLDDVMGFDWQDRYPLSDGKILVCEIGLRINGEWLWRSDGAGDTDVEADKGRVSDAFKRAAVKWGIGRYLYSLGAAWMPLKEKGRSYELAEIPKMPVWATPEGFDALMEEKKKKNG